MKSVSSKVMHLYNNQLITAVLPTVFVYYTINSEPTRLSSRLDFAFFIVQTYSDEVYKGTFSLSVMCGISIRD